MRKISEILKFAFSHDAPILPPKPDDLAIAFGAALMMTSKYETPGAAITAAWFAIPDFYMAREAYAREIAPMFFVSKSAHPPVTSPSEGQSNENEPEMTLQATRI